MGRMQFELHCKAEGSKLWNVAVVVVAPGTGAGFLRAAKLIWASSDAVVAPYLTALPDWTAHCVSSISLHSHGCRSRAAGAKRSVGHDVAEVAVAVEEKESLLRYPKPCAYVK